MANYILADNQELTQYALKYLILQDKNNTICEAKDKSKLIELLKGLNEALVILDYTMFDFDDAEQLLVLSSRFPQSNWLLISDELTTPFLSKVIYSSHSFSIVFKDSQINEINIALQTIMRHERYIHQRAMEAIVMQHQEDEPIGLLTPTERDIVKAIAQGKSTKEIAMERYSSVHTITTHRKNIFRKLGVNTAHEVVKYAIRSGLMDTAEFYI